MPRKVAVVGANGKVARVIIQKLASKPDEFTPTALIRNTAQKEQFSKINVQTGLIDLTGSVADIATAIKGSDAVIFSAGSGGKAPGPEVIDFQGAIKVLEALKETGIKRFIMVGALKTDEPDFWKNTALNDYYIAKKKADDAIKESSLNWTILRPGYLSDGEATGKLVDFKKESDITNETVMKRVITRSDVAQAAIESLSNENTINKIVPLLNGDDISLTDFIKSL